MLLFLIFAGIAGFGLLRQGTRGKAEGTPTVGGSGKFEIWSSQKSLVFIL